MLEVQDHYFRLAKKHGYVARSAFKLQEIDEKFGFFWPDVRQMIDIGCAPWSWLQYASAQLMHQYKKHHHEPLILWFDLKTVHIQLPFTHTIAQDITEVEQVQRIIQTHQQTWGKGLQGEHSFDVIVSDMAPDTLGDKATDALRSSHLIMETMWMYEQLLKPEGKFAIKVFMGPGFDQLVHYCRQRWGTTHIKIFKPKSCRKESKETYIIKI